jgi:hypothetical protein
MIHTGDVTHLSKPAEFDDADGAISEAGLDVHYVPGEHDRAHRGRSQACDGRGYEIRAVSPSARHFSAVAALAFADCETIAVCEGRVLLSRSGDLVECLGVAITPPSSGRVSCDFLSELREFLGLRGYCFELPARVRGRKLNEL